MVLQKVIFSKEECDIIINLNKKNLQSWKNNDRDYKSLSIFYNESTHWIFEKLKNFFEEESGYKIFNLKKEIHFHIYKENDWFGKHNDSRDKRIFSVGALLNEDFDGGDFTLYDVNEITLDKKVGNAYLFNVGITHEVFPITSGNRYSIIWFLQAENVKPAPKKVI